MSWQLPDRFFRSYLCIVLRISPCQLALLETGSHSRVSRHCLRNAAAVAGTDYPGYLLPSSFTRLASLYTKANKVLTVRGLGRLQLVAWNSHEPVRLATVTLMEKVTPNIVVVPFTLNCRWHPNSNLSGWTKSPQDAKSTAISLQVQVDVDLNACLIPF